MEQTFNKMINGYQNFRQKYALGDQSIMKKLSYHGQKPEVMFVACSDSRVDPAVIFQCEPGDLFIVRNVASIIPPYERNGTYHGTSAALEFGIRFLKVKHLILLGHSQCGGIQALLNGNDQNQPNDFISNWVSTVAVDPSTNMSVDEAVKQALTQSYKNALTFPWIHEKIEKKTLAIHRWFFDIEKGEVLTYSDSLNEYRPLIDKASEG